MKTKTRIRLTIEKNICLEITTGAKKNVQNNIFIVDAVKSGTYIRSFAMTYE